VLETCGFVQAGSATRPFPARGADLPVDLFSLDRRRWQASPSEPAMTRAA